MCGRLHREWNRMQTSFTHSTQTEQASRTTLKSMRVKLSKEERMKQRERGREGERETEIEKAHILGVN